MQPQMVEPQIVYTLVPLVPANHNTFVAHARASVCAGTLTDVFAKTKTTQHDQQSHWLCYMVMEGKPFPEFIGAFSPDSIWTDMPFWQVWAAHVQVDAAIVIRRAIAWCNSQCSEQMGVFDVITGMHTR